MDFFPLKIMFFKTTVKDGKYYVKFHQLPVQCLNRKPPTGYVHFDDKSSINTRRGFTDSRVQFTS